MGILKRLFEKVDAMFWAAHGDLPGLAGTKHPYLTDSRASHRYYRYKEAAKAKGDKMTGNRRVDEVPVDRSIVADEEAERISKAPTSEEIANWNQQADDKRRIAGELYEPERTNLAGAGRIAVSTIEEAVEEDMEREALSVFESEGYMDRLRETLVSQGISILQRFGALSLKPSDMLVYCDPNHLGEEGRQSTIAALKQALVMAGSPQCGVLVLDGGATVGVLRRQTEEGVMARNEVRNAAGEIEYWNIDRNDVLKFLEVLEPLIEMVRDDHAPSLSADEAAKLYNEWAAIVGIPLIPAEG